MALLVHQPWRDAARWHAEGLWRDETFPGMLVSAAERDPHAVAFVDGATTLTWAELLAGAVRAADQLAVADCRSGDIVPISLPDGPQFVATMAAVQARGAIAAPLAAKAGDSEIAGVLERTGAGLVVTNRRLSLSASGTLLLASDPTTWAGPVQSLSIDDLDPDAVAELMFTSGTTGRPKGVMNSANTKLTGLRGLLAVHEFGPQDVWGVIPPMSHNAGWLYTVLPAVATGGRLVSVGRGSPERMLNRLEQHGVTVAFLVPTHVSDLVTAMRREPGRWNLRLRTIITGAAPSQAEMLQAALDDWGITAISMYGMTECQGNLFTHPDDDAQTVVSTVGRPCPGMDVALRDVETGETLDRAAGRSGEIVTRGPGVFLGYYDDQAATSAAFTPDGWFRSGDLGQWRGESMAVVGRLKEVILRGGTTVVPDDVEQAFEDFEGLGEVVAVGLPDDRLGERICLAVTGQPVDRDALRAHLSANGRSLAVLPDDVRAIDQIPRTGLGKPQRAKVRAGLLATSELTANRVSATKNR